MFLIPTKSVHGVAALFILAQSFGAGFIQAPEIAKQLGIPEDYLRHLLADLKQSGLLKSTRGKRGGYMLARPPQAIRVREILECLGGPLVPSETMRHDAALDSFWLERISEVRSAFDVTLEEIVQRKQQLEQNFVYNI